MIQFALFKGTTCQNLNKNILSLRQIHSLGCKILVKNKIMKIVRGGLMLIKAKKIVASLFMLKKKILREADACKILCPIYLHLFSI